MPNQSQGLGSSDLDRKNVAPCAAQIRRNRAAPIQILYHQTSANTKQAFVTNLRDFLVSQKHPPGICCPRKLFRDATICPIVARAGLVKSSCRVARNFRLDAKFSAADGASSERGRLALGRQLLLGQVQAPRAPYTREQGPAIKPSARLA